MDFVLKVIATLGPWGWWVLGLALALVEVMAPGAFFIFFAVAAVVVGTAALFVDISWQVQVVAFVLLAVAAALAGRRIYGRASRPDADGPLNDRLARQVGRLAVLDTALANGSGHVKLDDTLWRVEGPDLPAGTRVRIAGAVGGRLQVEPAP